MKDLEDLKSQSRRGREIVLKPGSVTHQLVERTRLFPSQSEAKGFT